MIAYQGASILHCDNHVLVAVKPPNMPSQGDASGDLDMLTLMKQYIKEAYEKPGAVYLGLLHRLDRPVGGVMAFARTSKAAARLSAQLRSHQMARSYLAVVQGEARQSDRLLHHLPKLTGICGPGATLIPPDAPTQEAILTYTRLGLAEGLSLLSVQLETGRKHQIRRQLSLSGLPIWGDQRYGGGKAGEQIALWGGGIAFTHPTTGEHLAFDAPPPQREPFARFAIHTEAGNP